MVKYIYDSPILDPRQSKHWQSLPHSSLSSDDTYLNNWNELKQRFAAECTREDRISVWSVIFGYCEALTTHKQAQQRYKLFPIPLSALERLVQAEFTPIGESNTNSSLYTHRKAAQSISNWIWSHVKTKANARDELHANSLYVVLRGEIDGKSIDCFGAALCTVIGLRRWYAEMQDDSIDSASTASSILTLSEDHAYESHYATEESSNSDQKKLCTCEVAIPGTTKEQKAKRGQETALTFKAKKNKNSISPQTSWLYMGMGPVYCRNPPMILAAALANINCLIDHSGLQSEVNSKDLLILKRDLLWVLKDASHIDHFPFALCELGYAEEHVTSSRGEADVSIEWERQQIEVTAMEALYHQAITCSQNEYNDKQVYPYCYMGFFHKDGGQTVGEEYRLSLAVQYFSQAARVTSGYAYDCGDSLQLVKTMTKIAEYIHSEVLFQRQWYDEKNAVDCAKQIFRFWDYLLFWEERTNEAFLPILQTSHHKFGILKMCSHLSVGVRSKAYAEVRDEIKSRRLQGSLGSVLQTPKISSSEVSLHLTILMEDDDGSRRSRRKRKADT